jgi:hypothetical protein
MQTSRLDAICHAPGGASRRKAASIGHEPANRLK